MLNITQWQGLLLERIPGQKSDLVRRVLARPWSPPSFRVQPQAEPIENTVPTPIPLVAWVPDGPAEVGCTCAQRETGSS